MLPLVLFLSLVLPVVNVNAAPLQKRQDGSFTWFHTGLGACGAVNVDSDFIVALNIAQWDGGSHCFQAITIGFGGNTIQATITDLCPGCGFGGLDLTPGAFSALAPLDAGVINGFWNYGSAPAPAPVQAPAPAPPSHSPEPTTSHSTTSTKTSTSATPTATPTGKTTTTGVISLIDLALIHMGILAVDGAQLPLTNLVSN